MHFSFSGRARLLSPMIAAVIISLVSPLAARADGDDASTAGVARLSLVAGSVAVQRGDSEEPTSAAVNAPILSADYITTGPDSRAEVEFDGASMVRFGENVQARFSQIDPRNRQLQLAAGTIDVRLFHGTDGNTAIDTPSVSIVPTESGLYRVNVTPDGTTELTVRAGRANLVTPHGTQTVVPGSTVIASGAAANPNVQSTDALALDTFDTFNDERDRLYQHDIANAPPYVDNTIEGADDLAANGTWTNDNVYGHVWIPANVGPDWAPYRDGRWVWEGAYGWTWVAAEPWGWAPYHYGRWFYQTSFNRWAWTPPPLYTRPAWSPALVGFVGFNIGAVRIGLGIGRNIGWVPLAPNEPFHPWWGARRGAFNNVAVNDHFRNMMVRNAVTGVSMANFQAGRFHARVAFSAEQLRGAQALHGALPVTPTHANLGYANRALPASFGNHAAFAGRTFAGHAAVTTRSAWDRFGGRNADASRGYGAASNARTIQSSREGYRSQTYRSQMQMPSREGYRSQQSQSRGGGSYSRPQSAAPSYRRGGESASARASRGGRSSRPASHGSEYDRHGR